MTALEASSAGVKDMADGSLRITIEFDPRYAKEAFALFGARGTPLAIAALKDGYAQQIDTSPERVQKSAKNELGPLSYWLVLRCKEDEFQRWIWNTFDYLPGGPDEKHCSHTVRLVCQVKSRKDIDGNPDAESLMNLHILGPYMKHLQARGLV